MDREKKEPRTQGVKGLMIGVTNIAKINEINNKRRLIRISDLGQSIINQSIRKSIFKSQPLKQCIEEAKKMPSLKQLAGPLIYEKEQTILFAPTGLGKTLLAMAIAMSAAQGKDLNLGNGVVLKNEVGKLKTIFFDFELSDQQLSARMGGADLPDNLLISKIKRGEILNGGPKKIFELIKEEAKSYDAKLIIIDNISKIGNELEKSENAIEFMGALWDLVRFEDYTIIIIAHTPKIDRKSPITSDSLGGSSKLGQLADALIGINEVNSEDGTKVYIKQIKSRNNALMYGQGNVICTEIIKDHKGFVGHECYATCPESQALKGYIINSAGYEVKMYAAASYLYHESYAKASKGTGIKESTLKQRVKYLKRDFLDDYDRLVKMTKKDLQDQMQLYFDEDDLTLNSIDND